MRKRDSERRRWKIVAGVFLFLAVFCLVGFKIYTTIQQQAWADEDRAVILAKDQAGLAKAEKVDFYVGDMPYTIIHGPDRQGRQTIVWVSESGDLHTEFADDGVTSKDVKMKVLEKHPGASLLRITPGVLDGAYIWQAYYKQNENGKTGFCYDYYTFKDGTLLDTWKLSLQ